jgi:hypothetical protein
MPGVRDGAGPNAVPVSLTQNLKLTQYPAKEEARRGMAEMNTIDYRHPEHKKRRGIVAGRVSLACVLIGPLAFFAPFIVLPLMAVGFPTGVYATVASRGRSIPGWIGLAIFGYVLIGIAWMLVVGR